MQAMLGHWFKRLLPVAVLLTGLLGMLFSNLASSGKLSMPVQTVALEIQAAARDPGTQWMVMVCLASYFVTFLFLDCKSKGRGLESGAAATGGENRIHTSPPASLHSPGAPHPACGHLLPIRCGEGKSDGRGWRRTLPVRGGESGEHARAGPTETAPPTSGFWLPSSITAILAFFRGNISNPHLWLVGLVALVLLRYAFAYETAVRSLQPLVLLTGIVFGKGVALWAGWVGSLKSKGQSLKPDGVEQADQVGRVTPCAPGVADDHGLPNGVQGTARPTLILCVLVALLACASQWQPDSGMEFHYHGIRRWEGVWENPNLYGLLMGVGTVLGVGLIVQSWRSKAQSHSGDQDAEGRTGSPLPGGGGASVPASQLVSNLAPPKPDGAHGVTRPTTAQDGAHGVAHPTTGPRRRARSGTPYHRPTRRARSGAPYLQRTTLSHQLRAAVFVVGRRRTVRDRPGKELQPRGVVGDRDRLGLADLEMEQPRTPRNTRKASGPRACDSFAWWVYFAVKKKLAADLRPAGFGFCHRFLAVSAHGVTVAPAGFLHRQCE